MLMRSWESFAITLEETASLLLPHQLREDERVSRQCGEGPGSVSRANSGLCSFHDGGRVLKSLSRVSADRSGETAALGTTECFKQTCEGTERQFFGWDSRAGKICVVARCKMQQVSTDTASGSDEQDIDTQRMLILDAGLIEPFVTKTTALASAVEAASAIIRIHDVVVED